MVAVALVLGPEALVWRLARRDGVIPADAALGHSSMLKALTAPSGTLSFGTARVLVFVGVLAALAILANALSPV